jgi:hypothetical protein
VGWAQEGKSEQENAGQDNCQTMQGYMRLGSLVIPIKQPSRDTVSGADGSGFATLVCKNVDGSDVWVDLSAADSSTNAQNGSYDPDCYSTFNPGNFTIFPTLFTNPNGPNLIGYKAIWCGSDQSQNEISGDFHLIGPSGQTIDATSKWRNTPSSRTEPEMDFEVDINSLGEKVFWNQSDPSGQESSLPYDGSWKIYCTAMIDGNLEKTKIIPVGPNP